MRQCFAALKYMHLQRIVHRDIKPENFLLFKEDDHSNIKIIDFGLAAINKGSDIMNKPNGTAYYIAPEVLKGDYDNKCDIWSMGVVLYILMCGRPPFKGDTNPDIIKSVLKGKFSFDYPSFDNATDECKDLISKCLTFDPEQRPSADECYNHEWIQKQWKIDEQLLKIPDDVPNSIHEFINAVNLKKTTITFLASRIPEESIEKLRDAFIKIDVNADGVLTRDELQVGVGQVPDCDIKEEDWDLVIDMMDTNQNGKVDYTEFIAGCMQSYVYLAETNLREAFTYFDEDGDGKITIDELRNCLTSDNLMLEDDEVMGLIKEVDNDGDGMVDYTEFLDMMRHNTELKDKLT